MVEFPARTVCVAAGTSPNVIYEKEKPGTFKLDEWRQFFQPFRLEKNGDGNFHAVEVEKGETGFFTSYEHDGKFISYYGDNHPKYAGNVVKAMASAKHGYQAVVELFAESRTSAERGDSLPQAEKRRDIRQARSDSRRTASCICRQGRTADADDRRCDRQSSAAGAKVRAGQFYRLQNFETSAPVVDGTRLMMEGLALTGAWVDEEKGLLSMIVLEMGTSSRLCSLLKEGEEVLVMGPTGTPTEIPENETVLLAGGGLGNAVLFSIARALQRKQQPRGLFRRIQKRRGSFQTRRDRERDRPGHLGDGFRRRDPAARVRRMRISAAISSRRWSPTPKENSANTKVDLKDVDRIIAIGSDRMMNGVREARHTTLKPILKAGPRRDRLDQLARCNA